MATFFEELKEQRWDDHRFYHHSRVNQTLHLISACSFLVTYALLFKYPVIAALFGWTFAMCIRQVGHFFFEPKGYDEENQATHEHKEAVKVGYNLRRKVILHSIWGAVPLLLAFAPTMFGIFSTPWTDLSGYLHHLAQLWIGLAAGALLFRTIHLFFIRGRGVQTGLVWFTKILTDPFHGNIADTTRRFLDHCRPCLSLGPVASATMAGASRTRPEAVPVLHVVCSDASCQGGRAKP